MKLKFFTQFLLMSFVLSNSFVLKTEAQTLPRVGSGSGNNLTPKVTPGICRAIATRRISTRLHQ
ncbi:hypothetical protein [Scytonema hofmannii]|uniref:hypothetical protein n=1 Tax=Scytonema hofmannii TaxID=34078 RepID=UPI0011DF7E67|nr:hypothetical protein [Scytonema hofmannii]